MVSPHVTESRIRKPQNFLFGIRNPMDWNPESILKWNAESTKFGIGNPDVGNPNPIPLWILLHGANGFKWLFFDFHKNSGK